MPVSLTSMPTDDSLKFAHPNGRATENFGPVMEIRRGFFLGGAQCIDRARSCAAARGAMRQRHGGVQPTPLSVLDIRENLTLTF